MNTEKNIIIVVQTNPNTNPGGVQGAFMMLVYQSEFTPESVHRLPKARPVKFRRVKPIMVKI
jgi:hypothetical protein